MENPDKNAPTLNPIGWDAIDAACAKTYHGKAEPRRYHPPVPYMFGGGNPLDSVSVYDCGAYWHFVTFGLSELYEKQTDNPEISGYGMEFTLKLEKCGDDEDEVRNIYGVLQSLARLTFEDGEIFSVFETLSTGEGEGIDFRGVSKVTGFLTVPDPDLGVIDTPNGKVCFVEFVGITANELAAVDSGELDPMELFVKLHSDITSYNRDSVI